MDSRYQPGSTYLHQNPRFKLRADRVIDASGAQREYYILEIKPAVVIVALDRKGRICLVRHYRQPSQKWLWEAPIGDVEENDETQLAAAKKKLREETGFVARDWQHIAEVNEAKDISDHRLHIFIARDLEQTREHPREDAEADANTRFISFSDFEKEIKHGSITDAETILAVLTAKLYL